MPRLSLPMVFTLLLIPIADGCAKTGSNTLPDPHLQKVVEEVLDLSLSELESKSDLPGTVMGAVVAIDPRTRRVIVMASDRHAREKGINRASTRRESGSAFKPILTAAAVRSGLYTPDTDVRVCPREYSPPQTRSSWIPKNLEPIEIGKISLRQALQHSYSMPSVKIVTCISPKSMTSTARSLGIQSELKPVISTAYGAGKVTLLELSNAYTTFASGGVYQEPVLVTEHSNTSPKRVLSEKDACAVTSILQGTIAARSLVYPDSQCSFAVKSSTTPHGRDGWCIGYKLNYQDQVTGPVIGVWVGIDTGILMGKHGTTMKHTANRIWNQLASQL